MADLTTTVTENVTLNGAVRGTTNTVTTTGINDVFERIVTCTQGQTTTVAVFDTFPYSSAGAIDVDRTKYVRVTNLDTTNSIELAVVATTSVVITLTAGNSCVLSKGSAIIRGSGSSTPTFGGASDLTSLQIKPLTANDARVEIFVGLS